MSKILIISYGFPPALSGATWRPLKFSKYLPEFDIKTDVLTASANNYEKEDYSLLNELSESVNIYRVSPPIKRTSSLKIRSRIVEKHVGKSLQKEPISLRYKILMFIRNNILIPDIEILWVLKIIPKILKLINKNKYDYVLCTSPPASILISGYIAKLITGIRLITDFRDPWTQWFDSVTKDESFARKKVGLFIEKRILNKSDIVLATTPVMLSYLRDRLGHSKDKFHLLYNGVDPDDFINAQIKKFDKLTFVYTGLMNDIFYSPDNLFKSLQALKKENPKISSMIQFFILGNVTEGMLGLIKKYELEDIVFYQGFLPKKEAIGYIMGADYLLLLLNPGVTDYLTISGKLFEYLFSRNKILALIPERSAAGEILKDYSNARIVNPNNVTMIKKELGKCIFNPERDIDNVLNSKDEMIISKFNRKIQAMQLAKLITDLKNI